MEMKLLSEGLCSEINFLNRDGEIIRKKVVEWKKN